MPDLDLDALAAVAEAATQTQWAEEWFRCHADGYFRAAMGARPDLVAYFNALTPPTTLALIAEARAAERLRREVAALADEWDSFAPLGKSSAHADRLRALIGGDR